MRGRVGYAVVSIVSGIGSGIMWHVWSLYGFWWGVLYGLFWPIWIGYRVGYEAAGLLLK